MKTVSHSMILPQWGGFSHRPWIITLCNQPWLRQRTSHLLVLLIICVSQRNLLPSSRAGSKARAGRAWGHWRVLVLCSYSFTRKHQRTCCNSATLSDGEIRTSPACWSLWVCGRLSICSSSLLSLVNWTATYQAWWEANQLDEAKRPAVTADLVQDQAA